MVKIVVFDSGFGSLSIIKQIRKKMKAEIIYFADQANFPYGKKSTFQLRKLINNSINFLEKEFKPDLIVVGSNTPSIILGKFNSSKIIGVFPPLQEASKKSKNSRIGILTTQNVVKSKKLDVLIRQNVPKEVKVFKIDVSPLVELVESGKFINQKNYCKKKIISLLKNKFEENLIDVVTLSSTHLPFILPILHHLFPKIQFLDPSEKIAIKIMNMCSMIKPLKNTLTIYSSGKTRLFQTQLFKIGIKREVKFLKIH